MKLLITAEEPDYNALVDEEFGHSAFFVIYDTNTGSWEAYPNQAPQAGVGAGIKVIMDEDGTVASAVERWMKKNPSQCTGIFGAMLVYLSCKLTDSFAGS